MTLFGYGKTTAAIAKRFGQCRIFDDKFTQVEAFGTNTLNPMADFDPGNSELEIPSPGIPPRHPQLQRARHLQSEYDLFAKTMPFSIWISGTNGKTTTTQMLGHLLKAKGALTGGNIGTPLADLDENARMWILETSSFTLHYTQTARPDIYLLLPITPDHIDWHGSFEAYEEAKLKPLKALREGEPAIVPAKYAHHPTQGNLIPYKDTADLAERFEIDLDKIPFPEPFLLDAVMALAVTRILFWEADYETMAHFILDPHKMERFSDTKGRTWIDDSKATNPDATIQALKGLEDAPLFLILGGDDKGAELAPLFDALRGKRVHLFAIGKNASRIMEMANAYALPATLCGFLEVAVARIDSQLDATGIGLLSPAAASLDQFRSYAHRGEEFKRFVLALS